MIVLQEARGKVELLLFSPDGRTLVAPSSRGLQVWGELTSGRPRRAVRPHRFVLFEKWGKPFPEGYRSRRVFVTRDARSGAVLHEAPSSGDQFHRPVMSADRRLIAARRSDWIAVFRANDMGAEPVKLCNDSRKEFTGLAFHPSGRYLAATSNDATVKHYDTTTWQVAHSFNWGIGRLRSVAFSNDGMPAASGGDKGKIVVWDVDL
jgi:WD40 repeat protein